MKQFEMDGWVCGQIETRSTQSGKQVTSFSVNSPDRRKNQQTGEWETVPQFFPCQYWHRSDNDYRAYKIVDKAHLFLVGHPRYEEWESDGGKRSRVALNVRELFVIESGKARQQSQPEYSSDAVYDEDIPF